MQDQLIIDWIALAPPAAVFVMCLGATAAITDIVIINKGAKANLAWTLLALAFACFGVAEGDRVIAALGLPNLSAARDGLKTFAAMSALVGTLYGRALFKGLLK
ncbi:MAG: hypothetical protein AAB554_04940 [Patescibacteria group bacterium]